MHYTRTSFRCHGDRALREMRDPRERYGFSNFRRGERRANFAYNLTYVCPAVSRVTRANTAATVSTALHFPAFRASPLSPSLPLRPPFTGHPRRRRRPRGRKYVRASFARESPYSAARSFREIARALWIFLARAANFRFRVDAGRRSHGHTINRSRSLQKKALISDDDEKNEFSM